MHAMQCNQTGEVAEEGAETAGGVEGIEVWYDRRTKTIRWELQQRDTKPKMSENHIITCSGWGPSDGQLLPNMMAPKISQMRRNSHSRVSSAFQNDEMLLEKERHTAVPMTTSASTPLMVIHSLKLKSGNVLL